MAVRNLLVCIALLLVSALSYATFPTKAETFTAVYKVKKTIEPAHPLALMIKSGKDVSEYKKFPTYAPFEGEVIVSRKGEQLYMVLRVKGAVREYKLLYDGNITYTNDINTEHGYRIPAFVLTSFPIPCQMPFNYPFYDMVQKSKDGRDIVVVQNGEIGEPIFQDAKLTSDSSGRITQVKVLDYDGQPRSNAEYHYEGSKSTQKVPLPTTLRFETYKRPDESGNSFASKPSVHIETYNWQLVSVEPNGNAVPKSPEDMYRQGETIVYTTPHGVVSIDYMPGKSIDAQAAETVEMQKKVVDALKESNSKNGVRNVAPVASMIALVLVAFGIVLVNRSQKNS